MLLRIIHWCRVRRVMRDWVHRKKRRRRGRSIVLDIRNRSYYLMNSRNLRNMG